MMLRKRTFHLFVLSLLLVSAYASAQITLNETQKLASLCRIWGFLKYYHPVVASGKMDWDKELTTKMPVVLQARSKDDLSKVYITWINGLGSLKDNPTETSFTTETKENTFLTWVTDTACFDDDLQALLRKVVSNRNRDAGFYAKMINGTGQADFSNEKKYDGLANPDKEMRLLALFRYWNMVEYYFPSKYLIGEDWQNVLEDMIPKFCTSNDIEPYNMVLRELIARIHDSHGKYVAPAVQQDVPFYGSFLVKIINNTAVVNIIVKDTLAKADDIQYGDILTAIKDTALTDYLTSRKKYNSASNDGVILRNDAYKNIASGTESSLRMTFERNGKLITKTVHRDTASFTLLTAITDTLKPKYTVLDGNIGYVNMGTLTRDDIDKMYEMLVATKAVIFDVRNYPKGTMYGICEHFGSAQKNFVRFTWPDYSCPGAFKKGMVYQCGPKKNKNDYKGKIIVLMNENTQSHAEFTCMAFKTLPNVTFIGSQTAGADGNVSEIYLPGGAKTYFSGLGIYYPDGTVTQRIGIVPDIEVKPTIYGIQQHKDEVLDRALAFINTGK